MAERVKRTKPTRGTPTAGMIPDFVGIALLTYAIWKLQQSAKWAQSGNPTNLATKSETLKCQSGIACNLAQTMAIWNLSQSGEST